MSVSTHIIQIARQTGTPQLVRVGGDCRQVILNARASGDGAQSLAGKVVEVASDGLGALGRRRRRRVSTRKCTHVVGDGPGALFDRLDGIAGFCDGSSVARDALAGDARDGGGDAGEVVRDTRTAGLGDGRCTSEVVEVGREGGLGGAGSGWTVDEGAGPGGRDQGEHGRGELHGDEAVR